MFNVKDANGVILVSLLLTLTTYFLTCSSVCFVFCYTEQVNAGWEFSAAAVSQN